MQHEKILNSLNEASDSKIFEKKIEHCQSKAIHDAGNGILFNEEVLEANLCD